jgi:hypothetical protein
MAKLTSLEGKVVAAWLSFPKMSSGVDSLRKVRKRCVTVIRAHYLHLSAWQKEYSRRGMRRAYFLQ